MGSEKRKKELDKPRYEERGNELYRETSYKNKLGEYVGKVKKMVGSAIERVKSTRDTLSKRSVPSPINLEEYLSQKFGSRRSRSERSNSR